MKEWESWEVNEIISNRWVQDSRNRKTKPTVWKEALNALLDIRGSVYDPNKWGNNLEPFLKEVAKTIAKTYHRMFTFKVEERMQLSMTSKTHVPDSSQGIFTYTPLPRPDPVFRRGKQKINAEGFRETNNETASYVFRLQGTESLR